MASTTVDQKPPVFAVGGAAAAPASADAQLVDAIEKCTAKGHRFTSTGTNPPFNKPDGSIDANALVDRMRKGEHANAIMADSEFPYELRSPQMLEEFAYTQSGQPHLLSPPEQSQMALISAVKSQKGAKYYTANGNKLATLVLAAPMWMMRGDLFSGDGKKRVLHVQIPGEPNKRRIENWPQFQAMASQLGITAPGLTAPPPAATPPPIVQPSPAAVAAQATTPSIAPTTTAAPAPAPQTAAPPATAAPTPGYSAPASASVPVPQGTQPTVSFTNPGQGQTATGSPGAAPLDIHPSKLLDEVFAGSLVRPSSAHAFESARPQKAAAQQAGRPTMVREQRVFIMPSDNSHLNEIPNLKTGKMDPQAQKETIQRLIDLGMPIVSVTVVARSNNELGAIKHEYPMLDKFLKTGEMPIDKLVKAGRLQTQDGPNEKSEVCFSVTQETKKVGKPDYYPPSEELAAALAAGGLGIVYITMQGGSRAQVNQLERFLIPSHRTTNQAQTTPGRMQIDTEVGIAKQAPARRSKSSAET
jgi:hypothetical protein